MHEDGNETARHSPSLALSPLLPTRGWRVLPRGRPVTSQKTGFGNVLPTTEGLRDRQSGLRVT